MMTNRTSNEVGAAGVILPTADGRNRRLLGRYLRVSAREPDDTVITPESVSCA